MRKLSLKTYSTYTLKNLSYNNTLNLKKLIKEMETDNARLYPSLLCWCLLNDKTVPDDCSLYDEYSSMKKSLNGHEENLVYSVLIHSTNIEVVKFAKSFESENKRRNEHELKNNYRLLMKKALDELGLSQYALCKMMDANPGNFYRFYHKSENDALSLKKCELLLSKLEFK